MYITSKSVNMCEFIYAPNRDNEHEVVIILKRIPPVIYLFHKEKIHTFLFSISLSKVLSIHLFLFLSFKEIYQMLVQMLLNYTLNVIVMKKIWKKHLCVVCVHLTWKRCLCLKKMDVMMTIHLVHIIHVWYQHLQVLHNVRCQMETHKHVMIQVSKLP